MPCEMCGKLGPTVLAEIEGVELRVCVECSRLGKVVQKKKKKETTIIVRDVASALEIRKKRMSPKDVLKEDQWEVIADYGKEIMKARQRMGLTQKELAEKLNERKSTIAKLENQDLYPDRNLLNKLEHFLNIKLRESVTDVPAGSSSSDEGLTIGDLIRLKKKNNW